MNAPQQTTEWLIERAGHATASRFKDVMATVRTGEAATRKNYRVQLCTERLTGLPEQSYCNAAMLHGIDQEPFARIAYEAITGELVEEIGFLKHPSHEWVGASVDGLVGEKGLLECKCPNTATHIYTMLDGVVPSEHIPQIQGQLWVTGRAWVDFVSYDNRLSEGLRLFIKRVLRDERYIAQLEREVLTFLREVDELCGRLRALDSSQLVSISGAGRLSVAPPPSGAPCSGADVTAALSAK